MKLISSMEWLTSQKVSGEAAVRLLLLDQDIQSAQFALGAYLDAQKALAESNATGVDQSAMAAIFHNAKVFVCAMRRVGRLAESAAANRSVFGATVSDLVKLAWRKKKPMLDRFIGPRDAIEHIDGEIAGRPNWVMVNLVGDNLQVTNDPKHSAPVTAEALDAALGFRNEIVGFLLSRSQ